MKECIKCKSVKPLSSFYKNNQMADGFLNKCSDCCRKESKERLSKLSKDESFLEKERERCRTKYKRLNYKDKQKKWDEAKFWKNSSAYKNLSRKFKTSKGIELHHWNYNEKYIEDVFILKTSQHRKAHKNLVFDLESRIFKTLKGEILDTKEKHKNYLIENGIEFQN